MPEYVMMALMKLGASKALASALVNFAISATLNAAALLFSRTSGADASRELSVPSTLPPYRHVYGRARIQGSWAPGWEPYFDSVGDVLYGCIILNSRESAGGIVRMFADRRAVGLTGDPYDFGEVGQGTATVLEGDTTVVVTHGLGSTPVSADIKAFSDAGEAYSVGTIGATTFTVTIPTAAPVDGTALNWVAVIPSAGGTATNPPFKNYLSAWIGLGDQTTPPAAILSDYGDMSGLDSSHFWPSDGWQGRTVLWLKITEGPDDSLADRWPSWPPSFEMEMDWSKVYDQRDVSQDPDDSSTWLWSDNQALCMQDALRQNPIERYPDTQIRLDDFEDAADIADESVALNAGGTQARYRVGGFIVYSSGYELFQQLAPLEQAGAGKLVRIGGKIGYKPGTWQAPEITLTDTMQEAPIFYSSTANMRDFPGALKCVFPDPASDWEMTELTPYEVDEDWDGSDDRVRRIDLSLVPYAQQAMRIQQIMARSLQQERTLGATFWPEAIEAVAGSNVTISFPDGSDHRNGIYEVLSADPAKWADKENGLVTFTMPMTLKSTVSTIFDWTPSTDEQNLYVFSEAPPDPSVPAPLSLGGSVAGTVLTVTISGAGYMESDPNQYWYALPNAPNMSWWFRRNSDGFWQEGGEVNNSSQYRTATIDPVATGESYDIRSRTIFGDHFSTWIYAYAVQVGFTMGVCTSVSATAGTNEVDLTADAPSGSDFYAIQFWGSDTNDAEAARLLSQQTGAALATFTYTETGLLAGQTRYYFVRAITSNDAVGNWATATATAS